MYRALQLAGAHALQCPAVAAPDDALDDFLADGVKRSFTNRRVDAQLRMVFIRKLCKMGSPIDLEALKKTQWARPVFTGPQSLPSLLLKTWSVDTTLLRAIQRPRRRGWSRSGSSRNPKWANQGNIRCAGPVSTCGWRSQVLPTDDRRLQILDGRCCLHARSYHDDLALPVAVVETGIVNRIIAPSTPRSSVFRTATPRKKRSSFL
jgi:hypothetical protein